MTDSSKRRRGAETRAPGGGHPRGKFMADMRRFARDRGGAGAIMFAFALPIMILFTALAAEVGVWYVEKRRLQEAADSGALMGAFEVRSDSTLTEAGLQTPVENAVENSYSRIDTEGSMSEVTVNFPPHQGSFTADVAAVEVIIDRDHPTFFLQLIGRTSIPMNARAVATQNPYGGIADACILALGTGACPAINIAGNSNVQLTDCAIHSNGPCDPAVDLDGTVTIVADCITASTSLHSDVTDAYVGDIADYDGSTSGIYMDCGNYPPPMGPITDPFVGLTYNDPVGMCDPTFAYLEEKHWLINFAEMLNPIPAARAGNHGGGGGGLATEIGPGFYCGGVINADFDLLPGVYYFSGNTTFHGTIASKADANGVEGVVIIMVDPNDSTARFDLSINGDAAMPLKAPTLTDIQNDLMNGTNYYAALAGEQSTRTGREAWAGMLYYAANPASNSCTTFNGNSELAFQGAVYQPEGCMKFAGTTDASGSSCLFLVGEEIRISGTAGLDVTGCGTQFGLGGGSFGASGVQSVGLVE